MMKLNKSYVMATFAGLTMVAVMGSVVYVYLPEPSNGKHPPNVIIMLADDVGYGDLQSYGHPTQERNPIDRMINEGIKFTDFHSPSPMCSPSRASILTGRYPIRAGIFGHGNVFAPHSSGGLPKREITLPEILKEGGYKTGMVGKWHLGNNAKNRTDGEYLPYHHGFDYVGTILPHSQMWACDPKKYKVSQMRSCFLYQNDTLIEQPINLNTLTPRLVKDTKNFITDNKDRPFFFLLSFPQTHSAVFANPSFYGKSKRGIYGDAVNEMGWAVGEVLDHLVEVGIEKDTFVVFLSDQGPLKDGCKNGGATGFYRGGKATTWDGGIRVPAAAWWPGTIKPNQVSDTTLSMMDLFPTILKFSGLSNHTILDKVTIDGKEINEILLEGDKESPHEALFYYYGEALNAVRYERYKIHYYTMSFVKDAMNSLGDQRCDYTNFFSIEQIVFGFKSRSTKHDPPLIFDIVADPEEIVPLDQSDPKYKNILKKVDDIVQDHKKSIVPVESEVDKPRILDLIPCCNYPRCTCNYNEEIMKE
ncbi:arylsulfatase-like [Styela clava]